MSRIRSVAYVLRDWGVTFYRRTFLRRTRFIVIVGSCAKTTTKELTAAVLATRYRTNRSPGNCNTYWNVLRYVLRTRPSHEICVMEVSADKEIDFGRALRLIRPLVTVVTNVGFDHITSFGSIEAVADRKGRAVEALGTGGTAVLNADDARVLAMASRCRGTVVTYGLSPDAGYRALSATAAWPERLTMTVAGPTGTFPVETQLCGAHWTPAVLAALAVGGLMGVPGPAAADAIRTVRPFPARMSPMEAGGGVTFIRDDEKAPLWTVATCFDFLRAARATRKIAVLGTLSDYHGDSGRKYVGVAREALSIADAFIGVGKQASSYLRAAPYAGGKPLRAFADAEAARTFLRAFVRPGDLILLKGSAKTDHLDRIALKWNEPVGEIRNVADADSPVAPSPEVRVGAQVVVGLGNPQERFKDTPHNIGHRVVDGLAERLGSAWVSEEGALICRGVHNGRPLILLKLKTAMNDSGAQLRALADRLAFDAEDCIVVFDDLDLPLGTVRRRDNGSGGSHNGMKSIVFAFESEAFARVKVGIGRPAAGISLADYVLAPISDANREAIDQACGQAVDMVLTMAGSPTGSRSPKAS